MISRWDSYLHFPATGADFERYVGTLFADMGYGVAFTPATNDYGVDIVLTEPGTGRRIAVQTKFYSRQSLDSSPIQEVLAGLPCYNAHEGWVVTNSRFSKNAINLAEINHVRLIDNDELNSLISQVQFFSGQNLAFRDLSGLNVMVSSPELSSSVSDIQNVAHSETQTQVVTNVHQNAVPPPIKTLNMSEIKFRWDCSTGFVQKQISYGMPMVKLPNGRWSITEHDLLQWEEHMAEEDRKRRVRSIISKVLTFAITTLLITVFAYLVLNESARHQLAKFINSLIGLS